jgi:predicted nucleic acid-binding protein
VTALVLDASAAVALLRLERGASEVREALARQALAGEPTLVPGLFWLELVNVLSRRYRYAPPDLAEVVYELEQAGVVTREVGRPGVLATIDAMGRSGLTACDTAYLVLAECTDARLLTADAALARAAGDRAILVGGAPEGAEESGPYAPDPSWAKWRGAVAYLGELRRAV